MKERKEVVSVAREWIQKAENDLKTAAHTLKMDKDCPTDTVCFHAQQAVEKYLKALLVFKGIDFPKTHDIEELVAMLPKAFRPSLADTEQDLLTDYATVTRYPGNYESISLTEARRAVATARRVRKEARKFLPSQALRRRAGLP